MKGNFFPILVSVLYLMQWCSWSFFRDSQEFVPFFLHKGERFHVCVLNYASLRGKCLEFDKYLSWFLLLHPESLIIIGILFRYQKRPWEFIFWLDSCPEYQLEEISFYLRAKTILFPFLAVWFNATFFCLSLCVCLFPTE